MDDLLEGLNEQQVRVVTHEAGPLLVLAGPGSGKTRVLTRRLAYQVRHRALPSQRLLGITFTNRAAEEMKARVGTLLGHESPLQLGTFHWMCHAILRRHAHALGYRRDFRLLTQAESRQMLRQVATAAGWGHDRRLTDLAAAISARKNGASVQAAARAAAVPCDTLHEIADRYSRHLKARNAFDLDDLLCVTLDLLEHDSRVREICRQAHDEVLVDEYQDTNPVQHRIVRLLAPDGGTVVAVGDEDQSIYGWRQADVRAILGFADDFPRTQIVKLEESYRGTKHILRAASALVAHNRERLGKTVYTRNPAGHRPECFVAGDEIEEAEWIATEVKRLHARDGRPWSDFAALYRLNAQSRALEDALIRHGIPYHVFAGRRFYDRPEIRRPVAFLRLALDPGDDAAASYLLGSLPTIGPKRLSVVEKIAAQHSMSVVDALSLTATLAALPRPVRSRLESLAAQIGAVRAVRERSLEHVVDAAIRAAAEGIAESAATESELAQENLEELRGVVRESESKRGTLRALVDRLTMQADHESRSSGMWLMSLHAAKGLEFPVVFLPGLEEGILPYRRALENEREIEEERRLCYVGMTRASERLHLSYAHSRMLRGQTQMGQPSRFVAEIGQANLVQRVSRQASAKPRLFEVRPGERVRHSRWKAGTVLQVEGHGRDTLVTIRFDEAGTQRLQLCYAPLTRLPETSDAMAG